MATEILNGVPYNSSIPPDLDCADILQPKPPEEILSPPISMYTTTRETLDS